MKKVLSVAAIAAIVGCAGTASAVDFSVHGDLNHRFMVYTDHAEFLVGDTFEKGKALLDGGASDSWGEIKYRLWADMSSDDGNVKGVYALELGALEFGQSGSVGKSVGGSYSGDGVNIETRWAYLDMQIPGVANKLRMKTGLQPFNLNPYFWKETVMGVNFDGQTDNFGYYVGWERPYRVGVKYDDNGTSDVDAFIGQFNVKPMDNTKVGAFVSYQTSSPDQNGVIDARKWQIKKMNADVGLDIYTLGLTGELKGDGFFVNGDFIYQGGSIDQATYIDQNDVESAPGINDFDVSSYFFHADVGTKVGATKLTATYWYSSGDDDPTDDELNAYLSTDVDMTASMVIMEGTAVDDDYFTERPYILDKGLHLFKLAADHKVNDKLKIGSAFLYMMTAEDITYTNDDTGMAYGNDEVGYELNGYVKYNLYPDVVLDLRAAYLFAGDAMDYFEENLNGSSDEDIFVSTASIRFKF
ncbi:MAG: hypothetical protein GQ559_07530 [Desulfobulbaceae bacterium]|nr:hypothetical protein [Desulfobulbaceae bacterium]